MISDVALLFVYGTLLPGAESWDVLRPHVVGPGTADWVHGRLFDTGLGYPTVLLDEPSDGRGTGSGDRRVVGRTMQLMVEHLDGTLALLDEFEDVAEGLYRRVTVTTGSGALAWIYVNGGIVELTRIDSGDWLRRQTSPAPHQHDMGPTHF